ncbi:LacI family DNA-binding transcriptional regulator [Stackebrandtia nassauensis]|uniref:Transcriptional regulator, LacI family n=1 Tax=Stackebrandtia nassauensis (strain DSM 44728 / CIP 108903 / NRRL B-16338 / NBRC 102104 / LLR-40K-21) TaxID=446470 RepID=D3PUI3_STANL|nr:LacI family DNA-binding transcriptional regulator [Stackebrandtia nassauensis]ADD42996.1 transcriptional regulator, LacI family [Stackebrandtia nassauensis DSM 44728]
MARRSVPHRPTIADVAALAGVSKGAVSRAFNGGERISAATIQRIHDAATQLGWVPSAAARAINGAPTQAVGIVVRRPPELLDIDPFFPAFLAGVETVLARHEYATIIRFVEGAKQERACYERMMAERQVDGFLLNDLRRPDFRFRLLSGMGAPAVVVGTPGPSCPYPSVDSDSTPRVRQLIEHLIAMGHRRIAHVTGVPELLHSRARETLWRQTLADHGIEPGPVAVGNFVAAGGAQATRQLLAEPRRPSAIFYGNDVMAVGGMAVLAEHGLRVPEDVAVAGFDDIELASYLTPALSTVHCDYPGLGRAAAEMLLTAIGGTAPSWRVTLPTQVRLRRSTANTG